MNAPQRLRANLRVIWAITAKDVTDALKNKNALANLIGVAFMMVMYMALPSIRGEAPPLAVYDAGGSALLEELEDSDDVRWYLRESAEDVEYLVADWNEPMLGLLVPADFDERVEAGEEVTLQGYFAFWVAEEKAQGATSYAEEQIAAVAGHSVRIEIEGNVVQTTPDTDGRPLLVSLTVGMVVAMLGITILPHLMIEEKLTKTIDLLLVSPASMSQVVIGKALSGLFYALTAVAVIFAFNMTLIVHWGLTILAAILGSLLCVGLGLLLGSLLKMRQQLVLWGFLILMVLMLPMFLVTMRGLVPDNVIAVLRWIPMPAMGRVLRASFAESATLWDVGAELAVLAVSVALVLAAVVWVVRRSDR